MDNTFIFPLLLAIFFSNGSSFRSLVVNEQCWCISMELNEAASQSAVELNNVCGVTVLFV